MLDLNTFSNINSYQMFINSNNDKLKSLSPEDNVKFESDIWTFKHRRYISVADFSPFNQPYTQFISNTKLIFNGEQVYISAIELAKFIWLSLMENKALTAHVPRVLECIILLFSYLKIKNVSCLSANDLEGLYALMLTNNPGNNSLISRYSVPAYQSRLNEFDVKGLLRILNCNGCDDFLLPNTHLSNFTKALNSACKSTMGITLADYKQGGSFNFIGLDTGRHYIDFCSETFENHAAYAIACRLTYSNIIENVKGHVAYKVPYGIKRICVETLMGINLDKVEDDYVKRMKPLTKKVIRNRTIKLFCENYNAIFQQINAFKLDTINTIVNKLGLPETRFDNQEFVRAMLFTFYYGEHGKSRKNALIEFQSALRSMNIEVDWGLEKFDVIASNCNKIDKLTPDDAFLLCAKHYNLCSTLRTYDGGIPLAGADKLKHALMGIESAGTTLFVAMTGWRSSEFGFPLNRIKIDVNQDTLDSLYTPYRFYVKWLAPKTSSTTPIDREITLSGYILASQLAKLNEAKPEEPCLYSLKTKTKFPTESKASISKRVDILWPSFAEQYSIFTELDELELLQEKITLSEEEQVRQAYLYNRYDIHSSQTHELQRLRNKLRKGMPRYLLTKGTNNNVFRNHLLHYQNGTLSPEIEILFEQYLSSETKYSLKIDSIKLAKATVRNIRAEFLEGEPYPNPHGLRHMWAEAVLRRYRGDIGKFIRANFKHLNESFFMAYLKGKEFSTVYQIVERNVINSVVRHHLLAKKDTHREYAGGFDNYLSKVIKVTKVLSHEEYIKAAKIISEDKVVALKTNAWATCILRTSTFNRAKCSENGTPQRHNASPKLCLACTNSDITGGNFNGIVIYTRPEVEACRNPDLPAFVKVSCIEVLKPALIQVKKLRRNSGNIKYDGFINYLEESIEIAQKAILEGE